MRYRARGGGRIEFVLWVVDPLLFIVGVLGINTKELSHIHAIKKRRVQFVDVRYKSISLNGPQELPVLQHCQYRHKRKWRGHRLLDLHR